MEISKLRRFISLFHWLTQAQKGDGTARQELWNARRDLGSFFEATTGSISQLHAQAGMLIGQGISEKLTDIQEGLSTVIDWPSGQPILFTVMVKSKDLLGYIYHQFAHAVIDQVSLKDCLECGRWFPFTDPRQV